MCLDCFVANNYLSAHLTFQRHCVTVKIWLFQVKNAEEMINTLKKLLADQLSGKDDLQVNTEQFLARELVSRQICFLHFGCGSSATQHIFTQSS